MTNLVHDTLYPVGAPMNAGTSFPNVAGGQEYAWSKRSRIYHHADVQIRAEYSALACLIHEG